jgi:hypothetical protein
MKRYLKAEPFICIPSETFFTFTKRHLLEGQNVLLDLARHRPSNLGLSTGILMHLIRHVCHTPLVLQGYLRDALRDVRFEEVMSDFGMFFLHDLDLDRHCIFSIPEVDPDKCKMAMSRDGKLPRPKPPVVPPNTTPSGLFPLGEAPAWSEIKSFIGLGAQTFMNSWVWDPEWRGQHHTAERIFTRFTREYFATLKIDALRADAPSPITLEDAMRTWTVGELTTRVISCWFVASNSGLEGKFSGARSLSFRDHSKTFFPSSADHLANSTWKPFLQHGYIGEYLNILERLSEEDAEVLQDAISSLFGRLHCLPVVVAPSARSKGKVWTASQEGIHFFTNPIFYKLKRVGSTAKASAQVALVRLQRVKASNAVIDKRFIRMSGGTVSSAADDRRARKMARTRMQRLSMKRKNKRQPPDRWSKKKKVDSTEESEDERKESEDEDEEEDEDANEDELEEEDDELEYEDDDDDEEEVDDLEVDEGLEVDELDEE